MSTRPQHLYEFGPYRLYTAESLLLRDGEPVPLTPKVFETLVALVERSGHLVEKDELIKVVWSDAFVEESNLTNNVYALRKMLGQGENGRSYIETVPKRGYRFTAPVKKLSPEVLVVEKRTLTRVTEETLADDKARSFLEDLLKSSAERHVSPYAIALVYNGLGEYDEALDWLERAYAQRSPGMVFLKVEPKWNNLRSDLRFQDLLRRIGLTP